MLGNVSGSAPGVIELLCDQIFIFSFTQKNSLIFQIMAKKKKPLMMNNCPHIKIQLRLKGDELLLKIIFFDRL